jgi:hypothetical protein
MSSDTSSKAPVDPTVEVDKEKSFEKPEDEKKNSQHEEEEEEEELEGMEEEEQTAKKERKIQHQDYNRVK